MAENFAGGGGDDANVAIRDGHRDRCGGVLAADTDLVEAAVVGGDVALVVLEEHAPLVSGDAGPQLTRIVVDAVGRLAT